MNEELWWYLARASGIVSLFSLGGALSWGVFLRSRLLGSHARPAWLLDLHKWLAGMSVIFTLIHLVALMLDSYIQFSLIDLLVPFASDFRPGAVAYGVVATWLLAAVQFTSMMMRRLPRRLWQWVHRTSYAAFWLGLMHGATAGTDASNILYQLACVGLIAVTVFSTIFRLLPRSRTPLPVVEREVVQREVVRSAI